MMPAVYQLMYLIALAYIGGLLLGVKRAKYADYMPRMVLAYALSNLAGKLVHETIFTPMGMIVVFMLIFAYFGKFKYWKGESDEPAISPK